jgi:SAM-dependent methyltransferase
MVDLNALVVCPVCHSDLLSKSTGSDVSLSCRKCGREYEVREGLHIMLPLPIPDAVMRSKWDSWQQLQQNGLLSYTMAPEFNLSVGDRDDARAFRDFCNPSGLVLDVGCGPQAFPTYLTGAARVVGIDPLSGEGRREFGFVQGIGEYLPFRDETFDQIIYASSLDHMIDPKRTLAEARRCLRPDGRINLWIDGLASGGSPVASSRWKRYPTIVSKGIKSLFRHRWLSERGLTGTLSYILSVAKMKVPEGAVDCFHFEHLTVGAVKGWLSDAGLRILKQEEFKAADSVFVQARKE